jgi:poly(A) polymerase
MNTQNKIDLDTLLPEASLKKLLRRIGEIGARHGLETYIVGGLVRDLILNRPNHDVDIMVVGDALHLAEMLSDALKIGPVVKYERFGTAMLPHPEYGIEIATARKEVYEADSRNPQVMQTSLEEDLRRRDFTINAMAIALSPQRWGEFFDPFGGLQDIKKELLRTPMNPEETFFDDPLRMMRAVRFATQLRFRIDDSAFHAIRQHAQRIKIISKERIRDELLKLLGAEKPSQGLILLENSGLMPILLPQFSALRGVEERDGFAHKDVFLHTAKVVDNVAGHTDSLTVRLAAMFHDIGKPPTKRFRKGTGWTYHGHEDVGATMFEEIGKNLRLPAKQIKYIQKMILMHLRPIALTNEEVTDSAVRRLTVDAGECLDDLLTLCRADITSNNPEKVRRFLENFDYVARRIREVNEKDELRAFQSPFAGDDIMRFFGLKPSPAVGKIKKQIENAILEGEIPNDYEAAKKWVEENREALLQSLSEPKADA